MNFQRNICELRQIDTYTLANKYNYNWRRSTLDVNSTIKIKVSQELLVCSEYIPFSHFRS